MSLSYLNTHGGRFGGQFTRGLWQKLGPRINGNTHVSLAKVEGNLEEWENIFQSGKVMELIEQTEKVREFYPKYWKK